MNPLPTLRALLAGAALLLSAGAYAQSQQNTADADCSKARDPARCDARQAAIAACAETRGAKKRQCIESKMPPVDCGKAQNPARCDARQKAREACKDQVGKAHKQCLRKQEKGKPASAKTKAGQ